MGAERVKMKETKKVFLILGLLLGLGVLSNCPQVTKPETVDSNASNPVATNTNATNTATSNTNQAVTVFYDIRTEYTWTVFTNVREYSNIVTFFNSFSEDFVPVDFVGGMSNIFLLIDSRQTYHPDIVSNFEVIVVTNPQPQITISSNPNDSSNHIFLPPLTHFITNDSLSNRIVFETNVTNDDVSNYFSNVIARPPADVDFSLQTLDYLDFSGYNLSQANLTGASLTGANLSNAYLTHANLTNVDLTDANLYRIGIFRENYLYLRSRGIDGFSPNLYLANLSNVDLMGANLSNANLMVTILRNANLRNANLRNANLRNANLTGANLSNAIFTDANLTNVRLSLEGYNYLRSQGIDGFGPTFSGGANLAGANLARG